MYVCIFLIFIKNILKKMEISLLANSSVSALADNCTVDCDMSAENLAVAECVLRIIENGIEKIEIAIVIPDFLENQELLRQCMGKSQLRKCIQHYEQYISHAHVETEHQELHLSLIELTDLFCENRSIREILPQYISKIPKEYKEILDALGQLKKIAEVRLKTTAVVEIQREKVINRIYQDNENTMKNLSRLKKQLHDQEINLRWKLAAKQALIKKYEEDLATKKWENNLKIKQEILRSSTKIREFHKKSLLKQEQLIEEVEKAQTSFEKGLKTNLNIEKDIRDEKNKLLLQLQGLIKKYDQNIGEKIQENYDLQESYDGQREKLDEFLITFRLQEDEYNELAQMKLYEETAEFQRKLLLFMTTRAAKTVQRYWRKYIKTKKKSSKGKGKGKRNKKK